MIRAADRQRDNAMLCELARRCPQGKRLRFYHDRDDFWERCRLQAEATVLVCDGDVGLAGTVTVARKRLWLNGAWEEAAYIADLMIDPAWRGLGLGKRLLTAARQRFPAARLLYAYILADNTPSRRLFESEGFTAHPHPLHYHAILPRLFQRRPPATFHLSVPPSPTESGHTLARLLQSHGMLDQTAEHDGLFTLQHAGGRAWAALRRHGREVFVDMPWYASLVPLLPRAGRSVQAWSLHHVGAIGPEPARPLRRLLTSIAWLASCEKVDAVVVPLFQNDPLTRQVVPSTLTGWGIPPGTTYLYLSGERAELVRTTRCPMLLNGQDA